MQKGSRARTNSMVVILVIMIIEGGKVATLKVILLGSCNAGKTSIINKYVKGVFYEKPSTTVGVDFATKPIKKEELK